MSHKIPVVAGHGVNYLDCDFRSECCWEGDADWKIQEKHSFNINEFRRTFLVGRSKTPPGGALYPLYFFTLIRKMASTVVFMEKDSKREYFLGYYQLASPTLRIQKRRLQRSVNFSCLFFLSPNKRGKLCYGDDPSLFICSTEENVVNKTCRLGG